MKGHRAHQGLTLAELLITTTIVGVIMMGMVSVDYALRTNERQQTRAALVSLRTSATLTNIITNARQAYGDVATQCIKIGNIGVDNTNYICIYRDINIGTGLPNGSPSNTADDTWTCYTRRGTNLHKCRLAAAAGPNACGAGTAVIGTVTTDVYSAPDTPVLVFDSTIPDFYFQVTIKNRYDPTAATYAAVVPQEYLTNPKIRMTASVTPGCGP